MQGYGVSAVSVPQLWRDKAEPKKVEDLPFRRKIELLMRMRINEPGAKLETSVTWSGSSLQPL